MDTGSPLLGTPYTLPDLGDTPVSGLATGDVDGDGKLELVVAYMNSLHVLNVVGPTPPQPAVSSWSGFRNGPWSCNHAEQRLFKRFQPGDLNGRDSLDISDVVRLARALASLEPLACEAAGDLDGNGSLQIPDVIVALSFMFTSGPPPALPFPECGYRSTALACQEFTCP